MNTFGYLTVASPLHDARTVDDVTRPVRRQLQAVGGTAVDTAAARPDQPLAILVGTGGTEAQILDLVRQRQAAVPFEPVLLVAHPKHNSLPRARGTRCTAGGRCPRTDRPTRRVRATPAT